MLLALGAALATVATVAAGARGFDEYLGIRYGRHTARFAPSALADFSGPLERGDYGKLLAARLSP